MSKFFKIVLWILVLWLNIFPVVLATWEDASRYRDAILQSIDTGLQWHLDAAQPNDPSWWGKTVSEFVFKILENIVIPLTISVWVVMWIIWAYKLLFSGDEKQMAIWLKMVVYWVIWIIIMVSAKYIWSVLFEDIFDFSNTANAGMTWIKLSKDLYEKIAYPFIKIALYLALAVIFVILVWKSVSLITKSDWTSHKKALWMIWRCAVAMLVIIWAKNIVEAIYWKQDDVLKDVNNLWNIWSGILADKSIPIVYNIITWALSIISFVIFLLLLIQWFKILINPSKAENFQKLWKTLLYTVIWLFVIWVWYLLTNTFILN